MVSSSPKSLVQLGQECVMSWKVNVIQCIKQDSYKQYTQNGCFTNLATSLVSSAAFTNSLS